MGYNHSRPCLNKSVHAEEDALHKYICKRKKDTKKRPKIDLLVIRIADNGTLKNSKPCLHCMMALKSYNNKEVNIRNIYYSNDDGEIEHIKFNKLFDNRHHECIISYGNRKKH